ncbi:unnamed protein product [Adineta steineri]|nr:unnamed protein product [Adineta steineri]CAF0959833.1 unnamed protein product [Adineta steineri]
MNLSSFEQIVQNYISFMKLAKKGTMIVPTFDIDLIWHTHMRSPMSYIDFSTTVCGFILNHDDSIDKNVLNVAYENTTNQWKLTYQSEYGQNIDRDCLRNTSYKSSCVMIPIHNQKNRSNQDNSTSGGSCGGWWWESSHGHSDSSDSSDSSCGGCGGD